MCAGVFSGCHELPDYDNTPQGNFEALWTIVDEHYCFFADKNIDWDEVGDVYRAQVRTNMSSKSLFAVMSAMLDELRDGHVNLSAPFATSYYRNGGAITLIISMRGSYSRIISLSAILRSVLPIMACCCQMSAI